MSKPFNIQDYKAKNQWKTGAVTKEVGDTPYKGGHNDIRKTNYNVNIVDGKLDLNTHKTVVTEGGKLINEGLNENPREIADIFARYMIGDRTYAISELKQNIKNQWGHMEEPGKDWNNQFKQLVDGFAAVIKKVM